MSKAYFTNFTFDTPSKGINPITLSGKQASIPNIVVSAIFAAMVIHNVPAGHSLLCAKPLSLYVSEYSVKYNPAALTSAVCINGYFPPNSDLSFLGLCFYFPLEIEPSYIM